MIVLAIDTALNACSAALLDTDGNGERVVERSARMMRGHAEALMPLLDDLLAEGGLSIGEIDRFAVTIGPGTFTGVRVGVAAVRGFALATGRPAIGVTTLAALAATARMQVTFHEPLLVVMDARRGEVYAQCFDALGGSLSPPMIASVRQALEMLPPDNRLVFGTAAEAFVEEAARVGRHVEVIGRDDAPSPVAVARLALAQDAASPPVPLYLRPPDARPQAGAVIGRQ